MMGEAKVEVFLYSTISVKHLVDHIIGHIVIDILIFTKNQNPCFTEAKDIVYEYLIWLS